MFRDTIHHQHIVQASMSGRLTAFSMQNRSHKAIFYMQAQILSLQRYPARKALHTLSWPCGAGRQTASFRGCASNAVAVRRFLAPRKALFSPLSSLLAFSTYTRRLLSTRLKHAHNGQQTSFSSTSLAMSSKNIDGTAIAKSIRERLCVEIKNTQKVNPRFKPSLKIIQGKLMVRSFRPSADFCDS